jgi:hypothetical protein
MTLDADTTVTFGTYDYIFDLDSTGDFFINDNGTEQFIFNDSGYFEIKDQGELRFYDNDSDYVGLKSLTNITSSTTYALPGSDGSPDQILATNGSGALRWIDSGSAAGSLWTDGGDYIYPSNSESLQLGDGDWIGVGTGSNQPYITFDDTNNYFEFIGGNVGIGTTTPSEELHLSDGTFLIDNPSTLTEVGSVDTPYSPLDVYVSGRYAYIADYGAVSIVDISQPSNPVNVGNVPFVTPYSIFVAGQYAYTGTWIYTDLRVIDVSDPSSPTITGTYNSPCDALDVYVSGKYAYMANGYCGLTVVDVSDPTTPTLAGNYDTTDVAEGIYVSGQYAYLATSSEGLRIVDISDPTTPTLAGTYDTDGNAFGVYVSGRYAYVADGSNGLVVVSIRKICIYC